MVYSLFSLQTLIFTKGSWNLLERPKAQPSQNKSSRKDKSLNLLLCLRKCRDCSISLLLWDT